MIIVPFIFVASEKIEKSIAVQVSDICPDDSFGRVTVLSTVNWPVSNNNSYTFIKWQI